MNSNYIKFIAFIGVFNSTSIIISLYKIASIENNVMLATIIFAMLGYFIMFIWCFYYINNLIKKGQYIKGKGKIKKSYSVYFLPLSIALTAFIRVVFSDISQSYSIIILSICVYIISFMMMLIGVAHLLKIYFANKYTINL